MRFIDIHSHILHGVDDGSKDIEMSIGLLETMKNEGITDVIATPHFDANNENIEEYNEKVSFALSELKDAVKGLELPEIHLGCEVYYFRGIGKSYGIKNLTLAGSKYLLLELPYRPIDEHIVKDLISLRDTIGVVPILAHVERYVKMRGFKRIIKLIESGVVKTQINAISLLDSKYNRVIKKLFNKGLVSFIATDTHSPDKRPPALAPALAQIEFIYGKEFKEKLLKNSNELYNRILKGGETISLYEQ